MKINLTVWQRAFVLFMFFAIAIVGFMIKLPPAFRHLDKELHATFYFLAAAALNVLWANTRIVRHVIIFIALYLFGMAIEYGQQYSNRLFRARIHGRFDPEDLQANLNGLLAFSLLWFLCIAGILVYRKAILKNNNYNSKVPQPPNKP